MDREHSRTSEKHGERAKMKHLYSQTFGFALRLFILIVLIGVTIYLGIVLAPIYYANFNLESGVKTEISRAGAHFLDSETIVKDVLALARRNEIRLKREDISVERFAGQVHLTIRYADFTTFGRQQSRTMHTNSSEEIYREAVGILDTFTLEQPVRLLGVRISNLRYEGNQLSLFPEESRKALMAGAMDEVNDRYGDFTVTFGSLLDEQDKGSHVISPAWRPNGIRNVEVK